MELGWRPEPQPSPGIGQRAARRQRRDSLRTRSSSTPHKLACSAAAPGKQKAAYSLPVAGGSGERRIFLPALSTRPYLKKKCAGTYPNSIQGRSAQYALSKRTLGLFFFLPARSPWLLPLILTRKEASAPTQESRTIPKEAHGQFPNPYSSAQSKPIQPRCGCALASYFPAWNRRTKCGSASSRPSSGKKKRVSIPDCNCA